MTRAILIGILTAGLFCASCIFCAAWVKADGEIVVLDNLGEGELACAGFELMERGQVEIRTVGAYGYYSKHLFSYAWIIDAADREIIWSTERGCDQTDRYSYGLDECESRIRMNPGKYEVYYYLGSPKTMYFGGYELSSDDLRDLGSLIGDLLNRIGDDDDFNQDDYEEWKDNLEEMNLVITTAAKSRSYLPTFEKPADAVVFFNQPLENEYLTQGFALAKPVRLFIYSIGEYSDSYDIFVDGGWIIDAKTGETVWTMTKWNTERAGGADKNRCFRDYITLPAGDYVAHYATDDSHSPDLWNTLPPADPKSYGLTITAADPKDLLAVQDYKESENRAVILALDRVRDNTFEKAGLILKKNAKLRIYALGERSFSEDELVDYGWIADAETMERVWEMTADNTAFAGGAAKNCQFDGVVELPAGQYMIYYRSDDSHAYNDWNAAPPNDRQAWGITLYANAGELGESDYEVVDRLEAGGKILADLTGLGDDEEAEQSFTLAEDTKIQIIALGEGRSGEMYDYGWIENDRNGETIWEMTYRKSRPGGGADKNRIVFASLLLEKGTYSAHFVTDGSHSLEGFNASPPDEPERWGMLVTIK